MESLTIVFHADIFCTFLYIFYVWTEEYFISTFNYFLYRNSMNK